MDTHLYFGARKTCLEMLTDRHYAVPQHLLAMTEKEFTMTTEIDIGGINDLQQLPVIIKLYKGDRKTLFQRIGSMLKMGDNAPEATIKTQIVGQLHIIVVYDGNLIASKIEEDYIGHSAIEIFEVHRTFINPIKHIYQPKWRLMSEKEITDVLQRYEAKSPQPSRIILGSVCINDPVNKYYGGLPASHDYKGDVYEIIRDGVNIFYRKVVNSRMNLK